MKSDYHCCCLVKLQLAQKLLTPQKRKVLTALSQVVIMKHELFKKYNRNGLQCPPTPPTAATFTQTFLHATSTHTQLKWFRAGVGSK
jgi:hypothetical protein